MSGATFLPPSFHWIHEPNARQRRDSIRLGCGSEGKVAHRRIVALQRPLEHELFALAVIVNKRQGEARCPPDQARKVHVTSAGFVRCVGFSDG